MFRINAIRSLEPGFHDLADEQWGKPFRPYKQRMIEYLRDGNIVLDQRHMIRGWMNEYEKALLFTRRDESRVGLEK